MTTARPTTSTRLSDHPSPSLALVLTRLGRNPTSLAHFYWTPLFAALTRAHVSLLVLQPRRVAFSLPRGRGLRARESLYVSLVFFVLCVSLTVSFTRRSFILTSEYGLHTLLALVTARLMGSKGLIFKEHADSDGLSRGRVAYRKVLSTSLAHGTIANTEAAQRDVESLGSKPARVHRISFLVPPTISQLTHADPGIALIGTRPVFLFVGQLIERKNLGTLLEASSILKRDGLSFSVMIVGSGPLFSTLAKTTRDLDVADCVSFVPSVRYDSVGHLYAHCDVFVMPSLHDYRSVAVLEAMRFGRPVVDSARDGNAGDTVIDGVNGFIFDPGDVSSLAGAMRQFIERPELVENMGARSAECMADRTPTSAANALRSVLLEILERDVSGSRTGSQQASEWGGTSER